jgi:cytochrome P450
VPPSGRFPVGAAITLADLDRDPHPWLARLRSTEPVSWLPALNGWLVTRHDLAVAVMRDSAAFTVDDPRFTTAQVVGPSMLSLDGAEHGRHRGPFTRGFSRGEVEARLAAFVTGEAGRLVARMRPAGGGDVRRGLAGPLAVEVVAEALGLGDTDPATVLDWYAAIVTAVSALAGPHTPATSPAWHAGAEASGQPAAGAGVTGVGQAASDAPGAGGAGPDAEDSWRAGAARQDGDEVGTAGATAFELLSARLAAVIGTDGGASLLADAARSRGGDAGPGLGVREVISNAAVLMFGGIETTEGMIGNAILYLLRSPEQFDLVRADESLVPSVVEESLRLEPAAAVVDRYATRDVTLGGAAIRGGDLVTVSLAGAGRDPAVFSQPDAFDVRRPNVRQHLAFAYGPHFCLGAHLARLEAQAALRAVLGLPGVRLDPERPAAPRGLVFRKPLSLHLLWEV